MSNGGTYALVVTVPEPLVVEVGALGEEHFPAGGYSYVGSALGSGGFSRVDRHRQVASGDHDVRHWHVDYLLGHPATTLSDVVRVPNEDCECELANGLGEDGTRPVPGFGSSDCGCESHLVRFRSPEAATNAVSAGTARFR